LPSTSTSDVQKSVSASAFAFSTSACCGGLVTIAASSRSMMPRISSAPWPRAAVTASRSSDGSLNGVSWASTLDATSRSMTRRRYSRADGQPASSVATISSTAQSASSWPGAL